MALKRLSAGQIALLVKPLPQYLVTQDDSMPHGSYSNVITLIERLNEVFGIGGWYVNNERIKMNNANIVVRSSFHAPEYGIVIPDIFHGIGSDNCGEACKCACADTLRTIMSNVYIGTAVGERRHMRNGFDPGGSIPAGHATVTKHNIAVPENAEIHGLQKTLVSFAHTNYAVRLGIAPELKKFAAAHHTAAELRAKLTEAKEYIALNRHTLYEGDG